MPSDHAYIEPITRLLAQTTSAYDVPEAPEFIAGAWIEPVRQWLWRMLAEIDPEVAAARSYAGPGVALLHIASDVAPDTDVYLRVKGPGEAAVSNPTEKSVVLTLAGDVGVEAYRTEADVTDRTPWYVREFQPGSVYACHPGTLHAVSVPDDGMQLLVSRGGPEQPGRRLSAEEVRAGLAEARGRLALGAGPDRAIGPVDGS